MKIIEQYRELNKSDSFMLKRYVLVFSVCIVIHLILTVLFAVDGKWFLFHLNVLSVLFYLIEFLRLAAQKINVMDLTLFLFDVVLHACVYNMALGWEYGFSMYGLMVIPVTFYLSSQEKKIKSYMQGSVFLSIINIVLMLATSVAGCFMPSYGSPDMAIKVFGMNLVICAVSLIIYTQQFLKDIKHAQKSLAYLAKYDELTGLRNRHYIDSDLEKLEGQQYCIAIGDIDDFKKINDLYGHSNGDIVLSTVAKLLKNNLCESDILCRWGGEEFLIAVCQSLESMKETIEKIRKCLEDTYINVANETIGITMTFGIAERSETESLDKLMVLADKRLYYGKNNGKNQVVVSIDE